MSDTTFRLARLGEDAAIIDFINANFDMRLPLLNRPELYHHYYAGRGGVPQFAVAEQDGEYVSAAGYILANTKRRPDIWVLLREQNCSMEMPFGIASVWYWK